MKTKQDLTAILAEQTTEFDDIPTGNVITAVSAVLKENCRTSFNFHCDHVNFSTQEHPDYNLLNFPMASGHDIRTGKAITDFATTVYRKILCPDNAIFTIKETDADTNSFSFAVAMTNINADLAFWYSNGTPGYVRGRFTLLAYHEGDKGKKLYESFNSFSDYYQKDYNRIMYLHNLIEIGGTSVNDLQSLVKKLTEGPTD